MGEDIFSLKNYNYQIPQGLIAQDPPDFRDKCRLLVVDRKKSTLKERVFEDIVDYFSKGDVLVLNNTKVIKARLKGKKETGAKIEVLLLKELEEGIWECLVNPGKRARINDTIDFEGAKLSARITDKTSKGTRVLKFYPPNLAEFLPKSGKVPLPPYIKKEFDEFGYYQTVYAKQEGAIAAPTAGLHFTKRLIQQIKNKGVEIVCITLHCGLATFRPVKTDDIREHKIESEWLEIKPCAAKAINQARTKNKRIIAVGTTAVRALESAAVLNNAGNYIVNSFAGETNLYITPGYKFKIINTLITNFHTPYSTNLILISSFCGLPLTKESYIHAKDDDFRFYSFGDAMLII